MAEPRIITDLRRTARELQLRQRTIHDIGRGISVNEARPEERQYVLLAAAIASRLQEVITDLERPLPSPHSKDPRDTPMDPDRRRGLIVIRRDWESGLRNRQQRKADAEAQIEQALSEIRLIDEMLAQPDAEES